MQITTSFFTLLVASSVPLAALAAPVPNPSPSPQAQQQELSVDNLIQKAKGDPMVIVQQFKPIADQIASTIQEMITLEDAGAHKSHANTNDAHAHAHADTNATPSTPTAEKHDPAAVVADPNAAAAAPTDSPADSSAADPAAAAGGVQKRSNDPTQAAAPAPTEDATTHAQAHPEAHAQAHAEAHVEGAHPKTHPEPHSKEHKHDNKEHKEHKDKKEKKDKKHDKHKAKAAKAPVGRKVHTENVKKLRDLMAKANMMQEAIERVVLNNDQSIEKMPSDKDPKGVTWGLANAPVLAFSNMFNFSKQL